MLGRDGPKIAVAIEVSCGDPRFQLHIAQKIKTFRNMIDIFQYFRLSPVPFRPPPLLLEIVIEGVGILHAFHITAASGIAIPEPSPANTVTGLIGANLQTLLTKTVDRVQTGYARTNDDNIEIGLIRAGSSHIHLNS